MNLDNIIKNENGAGKDGKAMKPTEWELSSKRAIETNDLPWESGKQAVKIIHAVYMDEYVGEKFANTYQVFVEPVGKDLDEKPRARITYWLKTKDGSDNWMTLSTLNSLWVAIYGGSKDDAGVPHPNDLIGCVVDADVGYGDRGYLEINKYYPTTFDNVMFSDKAGEQYFEEEEE